MLRAALVRGLLFLAHVGVTVLVAPFLLGVIAKVKALFAGRVGPPVFQIYFDVARLLRKDAVLSRTTTWVFLAGPLSACALPLVAALLLPMGSARAPLAFRGDLVAFAYLFALGRFLTVLSALDTGSAFEGMGAAREVAFAVLVEPALFLGLATLVLHSGSLCLSDMLHAAGQGWHKAGGALALVAAGWAIVFLVENCRIPFDDPNTHLELTMIHEVMVLDHSGPPLALILQGAAMKLLVLGGLLVRLCLPLRGAWWIDWPAFLGGLVILAATVGVVESVMARLRLKAVPQLTAAAALAGAFGFLMRLLLPA